MSAVDVKPAARPTRILLAEDHAFPQRVLQAVLRQQGFTVLLAADGEEAVRLAKAEAPDLILLDMIMPKLQGFQVLRLLKQDADTSAIPVIVLSNLGQDEDIRAAMEAGAAGYVMKGVPIQDLIARIETVLKEVRT